MRAAIMCMTLLLSEPMSRAIVHGGCRLEWMNFTECVVTYVVTQMRFSGGGGGVISTAVLRYVEVSSATRLSIYVPQLCLGLLVMIANGWLLVSLQSSKGLYTHKSSSDVTGRPHRHPTTSSSKSSAAEKLIFSLSTAHCVHGAITVYTMTSVVVTSLWTSSNRYVNQAGECLVANSLLFVAIFSAFCHHVALMVDRVHCVRSASSTVRWTPFTLRLVLLTSAWCAASLVGFLPVLGWRTDFQYCIFFHQYSKDYLLFVGAIYFAGLMAIACGYAYAVMAVTRRSTTSSKATTIFDVQGRMRRRSSSSSSKLNNQRTRMTVTVAILAAIHAICCTPLFLHLLMACPQCSARSDNDFLLLGMFALVLVDALVFPLVYAFRLHHFDDIVAAIAKHLDLCKLRRRSGTFELKMRTHHHHHHHHHQRRRRQRQNSVRRDLTVLDGSHHDMVTNPLPPPPTRMAYLTGQLPAISASGHGDILY